MHPALGKGALLRMCGFGLRHLVLMVREDQVHSPAVDLEAVPEVLEAHRRALDVPARPPPAPGALPAPLTPLRALPQREVQRVALARLVSLDPRSGQELVEISARQLAVSREAAHRKVHVSRPTGHIHDVCAVSLDDLLDETNDLWNVIRH